MCATMRRHKLIKIGRKRLKQANTYTAMVLPPAVAGIVVLLLVYHGLGWEDGHEPPAGWVGYIPKSPIQGLFMVLMTAGTGFIAFQEARRHPTTANASTAIGIATTVTLSWATQQCNLTGSFVAGVTAAGTIIIVTTVVRALTGRTKWDMNILRPIEEPREGKEGLISAMQIGVAIYMGFVILIAVWYDELALPARPLLLIFAGVGLTAAATISSEHSLKNYMAIAGMIVSLVGAYIQIDQAIAASSNNGVSARDVMLAGIILAFVPFTVFAYPKHKIVRILTVPVLAAVIVLCLVTFATAIPAFLIASGCNAGDNLKTIVVVVIGMIAIAAGVATLLIVALALIFDKRETQNPDE